VRARACGWRTHAWPRPHARPHARARPRTCARARALRLHASTPARLHASTPARLYACMPLRLHACTPLRLYACAPLRLHASTPAHRSLRLHMCPQVVRPARDPGRGRPPEGTCRPLWNRLGGPGPVSRALAARPTGRGKRGLGTGGGGRGDTWLRRQKACHGNRPGPASSLSICRTRAWLR
jgi:hypothetical protein